jgi:hypothetical protein
MKLNKFEHLSSAEANFKSLSVCKEWRTANVLGIQPISFGQSDVWWQCALVTWVSARGRPHHRVWLWGQDWSGVGARSCSSISTLPRPTTNQSTRSAAPASRAQEEFYRGPGEWYSKLVLQTSHAFSYAVGCLKYFWGSVIRRVGNLTEGKSCVLSEIYDSHPMTKIESRNILTAYVTVCWWRTGRCYGAIHLFRLLFVAELIQLRLAWSNFHSATFRNLHIAKRRSVKDEYCSPRRNNPKAVSCPLIWSQCWFSLRSGLVAKQWVLTLWRRMSQRMVTTDM